MPAGTCTLQLYLAGRWRTAGSVRVEDTERGISSAARFEYDFDYLEEQHAALGARDVRAVSCRYPLDYAESPSLRWPAFLLDVIPSGAARRHWETLLGLPNSERSDWAVLTAGAAHAPGNVRVAEAVPAEPPAHTGFPRREVVARAEGFVEYARISGAPVAGSTGAGGDSLKFLLREDTGGNWHADGALPDARTKRCWLVKFARTRARMDRIILEGEAIYHEVAARVGARAIDAVTYEKGCLFLPRFDRPVVRRRVARLGLESLFSLTGVADFGVPIRKEVQARAVAAYATDKERELREFLLRDVLDVALGNTDNHGRNTSMLKHENGTIALAPVYDLAPMVLDARMIARVCRWADDADFPEWGAVAITLDRLGLDVTRTRRWLVELGDRIADVPPFVRERGAPRSVVEVCEDRCKRVASALKRAGK
jgi:serine/threonine-protein kinase HipA